MCEASSFWNDGGVAKVSRGMAGSLQCEEKENSMAIQRRKSKGKIEKPIANHCIGTSH
jgi:hypothetical protein